MLAQMIEMLVYEKLTFKKKKKKKKKLIVPTAQGARILSNTWNQGWRKNAFLLVKHTKELPKGFSSLSDSK